MISMASTLEAVEPYLPRTLVSNRARGQLYHLAEQLPAVLSRCLYLECRLDGEDDRTDVILGVDAEGAEIIAGANPVIRLNDCLRVHPLWERVRDFCRGWLEPRSPWGRAVGRIWLEFDLAGPEGEASVPAPGVFVEWRRGVFENLPEPQRHELAHAVLEPLFPGGTPAPVRRTVDACIRTLPPGAGLPYLGVLLPRGEETVRLCLMGLGEEELAAYLRSVGWEGSPGHFGEVVGEIHATRRGAVLPEPGLVHLDVGSSVGPRVGLEYIFQRDEQVYGRIRERAFLDLLVERGWCQDTKRQALASWPGCTLQRMPHELWRSLVLRHVNHVKVLLDGTASVHTKGYLVVSYAYYRPRSGPQG
jgi:hypothetical protein